MDFNAPNFENKATYIEFIEKTITAKFVRPFE